MITRRDDTAAHERRRRVRRMGCFALFVLLLVAAVAWLARDSVGGWVAELELTGTSKPSERLAAEAEKKLDEIARDGLREEVRFSESELQSLLAYRAAAALPAGIEEPRVDVQDSIIALSARLRPDGFEGFSPPDAVTSVLSDSSRMTAGLVPAVERPGEVQLRVRSLKIGSFVFPPIMLPAVVGGLGSQGIPTSGGAVVLRVPPDIADVRIEGDDVVLVPVLNRR